MDHEISLKVLKGRVAERARDLIRQTCEARDVQIVRGAVSPDHVHMLLSAPADLSPAKLVQYIKGRSSRRLQDEFPELRKRYWGQHLWARGFFCATVGAFNEETIREYIENHRVSDFLGGATIAITAQSHHMARNHIFSGLRVSWNTVPAVTEVW